MPKTITLTENLSSKPITIIVDKILKLQNVDFNKGGSGTLITYVNNTQDMVQESVSEINRKLGNN